MNIKLRSGTPEDAEICGRICYNAFRTISEAHGFAPDFPAPEVAIGLLEWMLTHPQFHSVVAEIDGAHCWQQFLGRTQHDRRCWADARLGDAWWMRCTSARRRRISPVSG
jgi:hypothetical protein